MHDAREGRNTLVVGAPPAEQQQNQSYYPRSSRRWRTLDNSEPASNGFQTYGSAATSYAPVDAVYAGTITSASAAGMPL